MCEIAKEEYLEQQCEEIENLETRYIQIMHEHVKAVTNKKKLDQIKRRWTDYIKILYSDPVKKQKTNKMMKQMAGQQITKEIRYVKKTKKKGKAVRNDKIAFEMIEA